jgi:predicted RNA binding protein YcfA (HicA-like mRNA interferase family)
MPKRYTFKEIVKLVREDGWYLVGIDGSHHQFKHNTKKGRVTIPFHRGTMKIGTIISIMKQAGLK